MFLSYDSSSCGGSSNSTYTYNRVICKLVTTLSCNERTAGGRGSELPVAESYEWRWAGRPAEASSSKLLAHSFMRRATSCMISVFNGTYCPHFLQLSFCP